MEEGGGGIVKLTLSQKHMHLFPFLMFLITNIKIFNAPPICSCQTRTVYKRRPCRKAIYIVLFLLSQSLLSLISRERSAAPAQIFDILNEPRCLLKKLQIVSYSHYLFNFLHTKKISKWIKKFCTFLFINCIVLLCTL